MNDNSNTVSNNKEASKIIIESGGRLRYYYLNSIIFVVVAYLLTKYNQNPSLISIIIGILILIFLPLNAVEYLFAEEDRLIVLFKRVFFFRFLNKKRIFKYEEIKKITAILKNDEKTDITAFVINLTSKFTAFSFNVLEVEFKNGEMKYINSKIYTKKLLPLISFMQSKGVEIELVHPDNKDL